MNAESSEGVAPPLNWANYVPSEYWSEENQKTRCPAPGLYRIDDDSFAYYPWGTHRPGHMINRLRARDARLVSWIGSGAVPALCVLALMARGGAGWPVLALIPFVFPLRWLVVRYVVRQTPVAPPLPYGRGARQLLKPAMRGFEPMVRAVLPVLAAAAGALLVWEDPRRPLGVVFFGYAVFFASICWSREGSEPLAVAWNRVRAAGMRVEDTAPKDLRVGLVSFEGGCRAFYPFGAFGRGYFVDDAQVERLGAMPRSHTVRIALPLALSLLFIAHAGPATVLSVIAATFVFLTLDVRRILRRSSEAPHLTHALSRAMQRRGFTPVALKAGVGIGLIALVAGLSFLIPTATPYLSTILTVAILLGLAAAVRASILGPEPPESGPTPR